MKLKYVIFSFYLIFINPTTYSQDFSSQLTKAYKKYFELPRESIFLHLNKNIFFKGENIWFSGYVYNRKTGLPFLETTNLYCGIYDATGKLLTKKLFYVENGVVSGNMLLDPSFDSGELIIKAYTNWMKNFTEDDAFVQKIYVLDRYIASVSDIQNKYSIHVTPEGGNLIINIPNTIGFNIESAVPVKRKIKQGIVLNDKNEVILKNIESNNNGIGKFSITPKHNRTYFLEIELNDGKIIRKALPESKEIGINISINNLIDGKVYAAIQTNIKTFETIKNKGFYLATHRDGMIKIQRFLFDKREKTIIIPKKTLLPGINIITLFDDQSNPVLERLIFNEYQFKSKRLDPNIEIINKTKDSIEIEVSLNSKNTNLSSLSVSILPEETQAYNKNTSIFSNFLLQPYIKTTIRNEWNFLRKTNRYTLYELDALLLTSGWSRYDWKNIFKAPPIKKIDFERGIEIKGEVLNPTNPARDQVILYQPGVENLMTANIRSEGKFELKNQYILKGETLNIGISNGKSLQKDPEIRLDFFPKTEKDSISFSSLNSSVFNFENTSKDHNYSIEIRDNENIISLDSVMINQKKKATKLTRNPKLTKGIFEGRKIEKTDVRKHVKLSNYIRRLGFKTRSNIVNGTFSILPKTIGHYPPIVIINDFRIEDNNLSDLLLDSVDEIYYEHFGMQGSNGGTIYIYQKYGKDMLGSQEKMIKKIATEGFEKPQYYFNPKLGSITDKTFLNFGHIHWEFNLIMDGGKSRRISFPHYNLEGAKLLIEGMTQNGKLISSIKLIEFNE